MRIIPLIIFAVSFLAKSSYVEKYREDGAIDFEKIFDEEREKAQISLVQSIPPITEGGPYTKNTKRHKEIVNELVSSSSNAGKSNISLFEEACEIFVREGLSPMPYRNFYTYINRYRGEKKPTAVSSVVFSRGPKQVYVGSRLDSIISDVFQREKRRREDGKKRKHSSGLRSQFVEEAIRNGFGEQAQAMALSTFYSKICRLRERGYL